MSGRRYSEGFKVRMVQRLSMPGGPTAVDLARETNVPHTTLSRWRIEASRVAVMSRRQPPSGEKPAPPSKAERDVLSPREWPPEEKLRVVVAAAQLKDEELGEFLRREGIHLAQLEEWRGDILIALGGAPPARPKSEAKRVRELEREIARKDKALAEVTALLVLEKKLQALFGTSEEEGDSTDEKNGKK